MGAECGLYVAIRFKREAVCHLWCATPVLGQSASRITFFGNLDGYAAATLWKGLQKGGEGWSRGLRELDPPIDK